MNAFDIIFAYFNKLHWLLMRCVCYPWEYLHFKLYNQVKEVGCIDCYCSDNNKVFGNGKTLSAVMKVCSLYKHYNGLEYIDFNGKKHCNNIRIYSNLELRGVPFTPLVNLKQIVSYTENRQPDDIAIFLIDEANSVLNSRNFKNNLSFDVVKSIVTCRHYGIYLVLVGQRFNYLDAFVRDMCDRVIMCRYSPFFRLLSHYAYNAYDLNSGNATPRCVAYDLACVKHKYFGLYDTLGEVSNLAYDNSYDQRIREVPNPFEKQKKRGRKNV